MNIYNTVISLVHRINAHLFQSWLNEPHLVASFIRNILYTHKRTFSDFFNVSAGVMYDMVDIFIMSSGRI